MTVTNGSTKDLAHKLDTHEKESKISIVSQYKVTLEEGIDYADFGKFNIFLVIICGLGLAGSNAEAYSIGYVLPSAECDLELNTFRKGIVTSANFIGVMGFSVFWGYISDTKGRKSMLTWCSFLAFLCSAIASVIPSFWGFTIFRFLNGVFTSGPGCIIFAYLTEFSSDRYRGKVMSWAGLFIATALLIIPAIGWGILDKPFQINFMGLTMNSWRLLMLLCSLPTLISAIGFKILPESPKFLYSVGRTEEAVQVLSDIFAVNTGLHKKDYPAKHLDEKLLETKHRMDSFIANLWKQVVPLFKPPYLTIILSGSFIQAANFAISSGLFLWYSIIINQLSENDHTKPLTVCQALGKPQGVSNETDIGVESCTVFVDDQVYIQNMIVGSAYIIGYLAYGFFISFLGNRNFLISCMAVSAAGTAALCFVTWKMLIDILFVSVMMIPGICVAVVNTAMIDFIPTHLCGMAVCVLMTAGRFGSIISSSVLGFMMSWNCLLTFALFALSLFVCLLLALLFPKVAIKK